MTTETLHEIMASDVAARFNISQSEADRIARVAQTGSGFMEIWEHDDWWTDDKAKANA